MFISIHQNENFCKQNSYNGVTTFHSTFSTQHYCTALYSHVLFVVWVLWSIWLRKCVKNTLCECIRSLSRLCFISRSLCITVSGFTFRYSFINNENIFISFEIKFLNLVRWKNHFHFSLPFAVDEFECVFNNFFIRLFDLYMDFWKRPIDFLLLSFLKNVIRIFYIHIKKNMWIIFKRLFLD